MRKIQLERLENQIENYLEHENYLMVGSYQKNKLIPQLKQKII